MLSRRYVLGVLLALVTLVAALVLAEIVATVVFTVTVAYLLFPLRATLVARGFSRWTASLGATAAAFAAVLAVTAPLALVVVLRLGSLLTLLAAVPDTVAVDLYGFSYAVTVEELTDLLLVVGQRLAADVARVAPVLALKLSVFALLLFALVYHQRDVRRALLAVVPPSYRSVAEALDARTRSTLFAIYVLQVATAFGTFLIALPVFYGFGYDFFITLAVVAALLQFLPIVGPSFLLVGLAASHVVVGEPLVGLAVLAVGGIFVAWLPDILIRPRLARETADLPGSLYFVGFVGGLLTVGPIGFIAGPLAIALVVELGDLLSSELNAVRVVDD